MFNRYDPESTVLMHGGIRDIEYRRRVVEDFRKGSIRYLVNCDVYTEGFDAPNVGVIVNAAITKSRGKYMQRVGRSTRPLPEIGLDKLATPDERRAAIANSAKPHALILDFTDKMRHLSLSVSVADILARDADRKVRSAVANRAKTILDEEPELDVEEALDRAKTAIDEEKALAVRGKSKIKYSEIDPFEYAELLATAQQRELIEKLTKQRPEIELTKDAASRLINRLYYRRGSVSDRQKNILLMNGFDPDRVKTMTHHEASAHIRNIEKGLKRLSKDLSAMR